MKKYFYYIGVIEDGTIKFVTKIDNLTKTCLWGKGKPKCLSLSVANDVAEAMLMNFIPAVVIKSFIEIEQ